MGLLHDVYARVSVKKHDMIFGHPQGQISCLVANMLALYNLARECHSTFYSYNCGEMSKGVDVKAVINRNQYFSDMAHAPIP